MRLCHTLYRRVNVQIHLHPFHLPWRGQHTLLLVPFDWNEFATSTRSRSLQVLNPINSSVFMHPFMTWNVARAILLPDSTITSNFPITISGTIGLSSVWKACSTLEMLSVWPWQPVTLWKVHLSMTLTVTPVSSNTWNSQFSTLIHLMGLRFCLICPPPLQPSRSCKETLYHCYLRALPRKRS